MSGRAYAGVPAEQRRQERRERLVEAALDVIGDEGTAALTVHKVCRTARLNERYFYESFPQRDDLLIAVAETAATRVVGTLLAALAEAADEPRAQATAAIGAGVDLLADDPRIGALLLESAAHPVLSRLRTDFTRALVRMIAERGLTTLHLKPTPSVERDATFAATMLLGGLIEVLTAWTSGALRLGRDEVVDRCVEIFLLVGDHATTAFTGD